MTFQELMDCWDKGKYNSNRFVYAQILDQAKKKNLIPVIGAGLSAWVGYPMWDALLRRHAAEFEVEAEVEKHLSSWHYDEAAEVMEKACGGAWFEILRDAFDPQQIPGRRGSRPAYQKWLPQLFEGLVLTTNFDRCLEDLYGDSDSVNPGDDFQRERADRAGFEHEHLLIKLHGDINDPGNMVLTKTAYDKCYGDDPDSPDLKKSMPDYLAKQVNRRPMLFLGCSLHQDRTCAVLRECSKVGSHYALLPRPKEDEAFALRRKELQALGICPIWYPAGEHDEALNAFFTQLAADCGLREETEMDAPIYPLVGRDEVVAELCAHYSAPAPEPRWVTGVAGIGKTEVCREVIRRLSGKNTGFRMPMVDCTNAETYLQFYTAAAKGIGLEIPAHEAADPGAFLLRAIPGQCTGVYFDNFEDIWRGVEAERGALVRWLLALRDKGISLLFSTQDDLPPVLGRRVNLEALDGGAERAEKLGEAEFLDMDSVKLFTYIYGDVERGELPYLRKLIRQMEGHPLAIVLTATQARQSLLGMRTLLDRWDAAQEVYRGNARHTSLKNALALVWEEIRKDPMAIAYWALHTTCVQPIPVEFHRWLVPTPEMQAGMNRLQTGSLVRRVNGHIAMLLPIKEQLPLLMRNWEVLRVLSLRHWAAVFSGLLDLANDNPSPDSLQAHQLAVELMPQVCHVLDALAEEGNRGIDRLCRLLEDARNHYPYYLSSCNTLKQLADHPSLKERPEDRGIAYECLGEVLGIQGDKNEARAALEQAEEQFRNVGNNVGLAHTLLAKAEQLLSVGDYEGANTAFDQAEKLYREAGDDLGLANVLQSRGNLLGLQADFKGAESAYDEAEKKYRDLKSNLGLANTLTSRGALLALQREYDKAMKTLEEAYSLYLELRNLRDQAQCLRVQYLCLIATDRAGEADQLRPKLEALLPNLPPPDQEQVKEILAYSPSKPEE